MINSKRLLQMELFQKRLSGFFENLIDKKWNDEFRLSTKEAAAFLDISPNAVRIRVHRNKLKAEKDGEKLKFRLSDLISSFKPLED